MEVDSVGGGTTSACAENTHRRRLEHQPNRNYLRVRGEYYYTMFIVCCQVELPPRARRIQREYGKIVRGVGTTSACAENTIFMGLSASARGNYLRVRGEYLSYVDIPYSVMELPPRARRIRYTTPSSTLCGGTTSACAENTWWLGGLTAPRWNYLRVRGEYPK